MSTRTLESPFRETQWDQRLDKMLDDLKTTVTPDSERPSSRKDASLSSFRSSSRSESRNSNRSGIEDAGSMRHHHKEYTSPDKSTKIVTDQYEYESGDPNKQYQKKVMKSTYSNYKVTGDLSSNLDSLRQGPDPAIMAAARATSDQQTDNTKGPTPAYSTNSYSSSKSTRNITTGITNGKLSYDDEDDAELIHEPMSGEVRKIVWRNRFEKTFESQDGTPSITIEEEARRRNQNVKTTTLSTIQPQPPQISPGGHSWADPIPMPTPPQLSPKGEPGVAYVYTYGQSGSQVQHMPPVNYVRGGSIPPSEGAPSPTPSGTQPIIYHYSYHYNIQPGQPLPDGALPHPPGSHPPHQPALQMAPTNGTLPGKPGTLPGPTTSYDYRSNTTKTNQTITESNTNVQHHHHHPPGTASRPHDPHGRPHSPNEPRDPHDRPGDRGFPKDTDPRPFPTEGPNANISITINKSSSSHVTHSKEYPPGGPSTSTPFPTTGRRSRSSSPDRYTSRDPGTSPYGSGPYGPGPHGPGTHGPGPHGPGHHGPGPHGTITNITHTTTRHEFSDSLDRVRRPPNEGLPFPDTSPIKHRAETKFPKRVDDLMTSLSDSEDGPHSPVDVRVLNGPKPPHEKEPLISAKVSSSGTEVALNEKKTGIKREESKNIAGPPVYYPPGHHQLFDESMHTMTLKENKRRGMAKWRMEKASGYKESASSSESKGGMAMVPVCLPLCCGAACVLM